MAETIEGLKGWLDINFPKKVAFEQVTTEGLPTDSPAFPALLRYSTTDEQIYSWSIDNGVGSWKVGFGGSGGLTPEVVNTNFKASINKIYLCDISSNSITVDMSNFISLNKDTQLYECNIADGKYFEVYIVKGDTKLHTVTLDFSSLQSAPYNYTLKLEGKSGTDADFIFDLNSYFRFTYFGDSTIGFKINSMNGAVPKDSGIIGSIIAFAGFTPPNGHFFADGSSKSRVDYETLFNVFTFSILGTTTTGTKNVTTGNTSGLYAGEKIESIGIPFGTTITSIVDSTHFTISNNATITGSTSILVLPYGTLTADTFKLPNMKGRILVMPDATTEFKAVGSTGGEKSHVLSISEMPSHNHGYRTANGTEYCSNAWNTDESCCDEPWGDYTTSNTGGGQSHNNLQPYLCCNYIIKY